MKGVFDTKSDSGYDDEITVRYHFPKRYRATAEKFVGDWVLYREPRRNEGREAYTSFARVRGIEPDPGRPGHFYAYVDNFEQLGRPVPFKADDRYAEGPLRDVEPRSVGRWLQGKSVRSISEEDFGAIVHAGLRDTLDLENRVRFELDELSTDEGTQALLQLPPDEQERRIGQFLLNRKIRAANFRKLVCDAYDSRCAVTGLRMINGGGKAEAQAAHIWAVAKGGPDVVQNGIALSGTAHWLFDRHLISLTDDYRLLVSHNKVPAEFRGLFTKQLDRIHLPADRKTWPHPSYIARHRAEFAS